MQAVLQNGASTALNHREPGYTDKIKVACSCALSFFLHTGTIDVLLALLA